MALKTKNSVREWQMKHYLNNLPVIAALCFTVIVFPYLNGIEHIALK